MKSNGRRKVHIQELSFQINFIVLVRNKNMACEYRRTQLCGILSRCEEIDCDPYGHMKPKSKEQLSPLKEAIRQITDPDPPKIKLKFKQT